jgi:hypothetical protein
MTSVNRQAQEFADPYCKGVEGMLNNKKKCSLPIETHRPKDRQRRLSVGNIGALFPSMSHKGGEETAKPWLS